MRYTKNLTEEPSSLKEIFNLIEGKAIKQVIDLGNEFQLQLSNDFLLKISGTEVNLLMKESRKK